MNTIITSQRIASNQRISHTARLFGLNFPMRLEPMVFATADRLSCDYQGGMWIFSSLSTGGFFMFPDSEETFQVSCENGFEGALSAEAFGIVCCMYSYSGISFSGDAFAETCAEQYHLLSEFALDHAEVGSIMQAID